jgi:amino acid adenylation domain-containing protein
LAQLKERIDPRRVRLDITRAPMMRVYVAQEPASNRWLMVCLTHHLVDDHISSRLLAREVEIYLRGQLEELPEVLPFRHFVWHVRQRRRRDEHKAFFRQMLQGVEEPTAPFGLMEVHGDGTGIVEACHTLHPQLSRRVRACARALGVSTASLFHVGWAQLLSRASGQDTPVFGTVLFGRTHASAEVEQVMGTFINTLPVCIDLRAVSVEQCVRQTHQLIALLLLHEHASLAEVQQYSQVPSGVPLFTTLLNYRQRKTAEQQWSAEGSVENLNNDERTNYPLALFVDDWGKDFELTVQADAALGAERVCAMMRTTLEYLVRALEESPNQLVSELDVLPEEERKQLLRRWNETAMPYPQDRCIHELFEEKVVRAPDAVALINEDQHLSYGELNRRSNQLAHYLRARGVGPDRRVALCMPRSFELIVGLLGILKAGGAYVPLDPAYPAERLAFMLRDSGAVALLTEARLHEGESALRAADLSVPVILLDREEERASISAQSEENIDPRMLGLTAEHLAYVIYTSGSTGVPKAVGNSIGGLANRLSWFVRFISRGAPTTALKTNIGFVDSVTEILQTLMAGGTLVVFNDETTRDVGLFARQIAQFKVTTLVLVPSLLAHLVEIELFALESIEVLICSGERLAPDLIQRVKKRYPRIRLLNFYGSSEVNGDATALDCAELPDALDLERSVIGRPIANMRVYILDEHRRPVPIGVTGEMYIGGAGVARGYLNRPDLTDERFIASPFVAGDRLYKTGDLARYLEDGNIEFLGRNDDQVKIRGFRIELGEIEAQLRGCEGVREAVVITRENTLADKRLVAYYTIGEDTEVGAEQLRNHLSRTLASYMVPAAYVQLSELPLTPNGKLDRSALPAPDDQSYAKRQYEAPHGAVEITLAGIWREVLGVERVGRHDNFFELGGHSLLVTNLMGRISDSFAVPFYIKVIFHSPTLQEMAQFIERLLLTKQPVSAPNEIELEEGLI